MQPFTVLTAVAAPLEIAKIDTGMILPGRYMRRHRRPGHDYGEAFLYDLRFDDKGQPRADFPTNQPAYRDAKILVSDQDFGCGHFSGYFFHSRCSAVIAAEIAVTALSNQPSARAARSASISSFSRVPRWIDASSWPIACSILALINCRAGNALTFSSLGFFALLFFFGCSTSILKSLGESRRTSTLPRK